MIIVIHQIACMNLQFSQQKPNLVYMLNTGTFEFSTTNFEYDPCPVGYYCQSNSTTPTICPAYGYCPEGSSSPEPCPNGTYTQDHVTGLQTADQCEYCTTGMVYMFI